MIYSKIRRIEITSEVVDASVPCTMCVPDCSAVWCGLP
jgi:hypothetical protein